jgi:hypothetical protein
MVAAENTSENGAPIASPKVSKIKLIAAASGLVLLAGAIGWVAPQLFARYNATTYVGQDASVVAVALNCSDFKQSGKHDESVYKYHDQGTCTLDKTTVTITTFDKASDGDAFITLMNGLIPVLHPTWVGAATATGEGWNVADATNLSPQIAEAVVRRLGAGEVRIIPSAGR